jgi:hypothetical protein
MFCHDRLTALPRSAVRERESTPVNGHSWWPVPAFAPLCFVVLWLDSPRGAVCGTVGPILADILAPFYFILMLRSLPDDLRCPIVLMVPLTAVGEWLLCDRLNLYAYRRHGVPFYVPFGHAILLGTAMLLCRLPWTSGRSRLIERFLIPSFGVIITATVIELGDHLSLVGGLFFGLVLLRRSTRLLYLAVGFLVLFVEFAGTWLSCWSWHPEPFHGFRTGNPPVGAVCFYVLADRLTIEAVRIVRIWRERWLRDPE